MASENTNKLFTDASESIINVVNAEITLIDLDAELQTDLSQEEFVARDKELFIKSVRSSLVRVLSDIAGVSMDRWHRVEEAFPDKFPPAPPKKADAPGSGGGGGGETQCPPGFINDNGICVPIDSKV